MSRTLLFRNRQETRQVRMPLLRRVTKHVLEEELKLAEYELGFHLVEPEEMARVNWQFLQHEGSTDVITFDYGDGTDPGPLHGEAYICVSDAVRQAKEFGTTWPEEVVRYIVHAVLHLQGFDDLKPGLRRIMKREENRLMKRVSSQFPLKSLGRSRDTSAR